MATVTGSKRHLDITSNTLTTSSNVDVGAKLFITTTDSNTTSTTALVLNGDEVEARTLGSNAFNSTAFLTSETFSSSDVVMSLSGDDIIAGTSITLAGGLSFASSTNTLTSANTTYSAGTLLDLSGTTFNVDLSELSNNTATFAPTQDHFVILDNGTQYKKLASSIFGSAAYEASTAFATASHNHGGVYVPEYEALQPSGSDREMNVWRKTHAVYSDDGNISTYIVINTEVPQDNYSMGGFTLVYQDNYSSSGEGGEIKIYGYWNPESNGGFTGFRYECSNPYHTPTIEVCRNSSSGNTAFFISGEGGNYSQLIAKDLWLGYSASSATQQWGNGWTITEASDKDGYTNFDTLNRNDFAAITTNGSTPSLTGGVTASEVRSLINAQEAGTYLTAHPSITQAANVDNSGGTVVQDLTFDSNGHVTATNSVNLDNIYTSTDGTEDDFRFSLNLGNFTGTRWYRVGTVNTGSGGMRIRGMLTNHVESFGSCMIDLAIQGRDANANNEIEITGHVHSLNENSGIAVYQSETSSGSYRNWDVYVVATKYTQCELDLTKVSCSFDTSGNSVTTEPSGTLELDTSALAEGNYVIRDSTAHRVFDSGINLSGGLSYTASTNTLSQTDNNTEYSAATTSADGLMSSTDKTKLDGVATGADVTPSWVPASDPSYLTALPSHNHNSLYYTESEMQHFMARALGWVSGYGSSSAGFVNYDFAEDAIIITGAGDTTTGGVFKAIRVKSGDKVRFTVMLKGSVASTSGLYLRLYQHNGDMPDGKTHVSNNASSSEVVVQEDDSGVTNWQENTAIPENWTNYEVTYTAAADGYVSLVVLNWAGHGEESIYVKQPDIQFEKINDASKLGGVAASSYLTGIASNSVGITELNVTDGTNGQVLTTNGSGTLSFTTAASGGENNVQSNWNETDTSSDAFILNKPTLFDGAYSSLSGVPSTFSPSAHNHDGRYYTESESDQRFPRGRTVTYSDAEDSGGSDAWYKIFQVTDSGSSPVECHIRCYAHTSLSFVVSEGYQGGHAHINILDALSSSTNNNYKFIEGVRVASNGDVEVLLNGGANVSIEMTLVGDATPVAALEVSTAEAESIKDSVTVLSNGMMRTYGKLYIGDTDTNTTSTTALVLNGEEVESRTLGSNAFTSYSDHSTQGYLTAHPAVTEATTNLSNSGRTYIQSITLDSNGHVTGVSTGTETVTNTNTTYSAGSGLDLTSTTFSVEADLRDGITHVGKDTNNYITFDSTNGRIDFYAGGNFVARMESDGDLHIKGDVIAFSNIFG